MPKAKGTAIPLATFLESASREPEVGELPDGPSANGKDVSTGWMREDEVQGPLAVPLRAVASVDEFKAAIDLSLREFLSNGDYVEATRCVLELGAPQFHYQVVKRGVTLAMDKAGREREMIAVLFSSLHARGVLTAAQIADGFRALLDSVDDLQIDIPDAPALLSHYLADSHLDGMLRLSQLDDLDAAFGDAASSPAAAQVLSLTKGRLVGRVPTGGSQVDPRKVRSQLRGVVEEYLDSKDVLEVSRRIRELHVPVDLEHELVRAAIELGLDRKDHDRELVSRLLSQAHDAWLSPANLARGFEQLLARVDDLAIDNPKAVEHLAAFMTRAVADELLPPAFVTTPPPEALATKAQLSVLTLARAPLVASHFGEKRIHVWGAAAGGDLEQLKKEVLALVAEFLVSGELDEAVRCVRELEAPSYHHEVIKKLVSSAIVDGGARELELALGLAQRLSQEQLLTADQLGHGCMRLIDAAPDLRLDHPRAPELLADFLERCCKLSLFDKAEEWRGHALALKGRNGTGAATAA